MPSVLGLVEPAAPEPVDKPAAEPEAPRGPGAPERELWLAVIVRAFADAQSPEPDERLAAQVWLRGESSEIGTVAGSPYTVALLEKTSVWQPTASMACIRLMAPQRLLR